MSTVTVIEYHLRLSLQNLNCAVDELEKLIELHSTGTDPKVTEVSKTHLTNWCTEAHGNLELVLDDLRNTTTL